MRKKFPGEVERGRIVSGPHATKKGDTFGAFILRRNGIHLRVIACDGEDTRWDHVSVSLPDRCPTWDEMEFVKRRFFALDETAMQLHVPVVDHINISRFCLHIWRPLDADIPVPAKVFV